jgi:hypothetical protein
MSTISSHTSASARPSSAKPNRLCGVDVLGRRADRNASRATRGRIHSLCRLLLRDAGSPPSPRADIGHGRRRGPRGLLTSLQPSGRRSRRAAFVPGPSRPRSPRLQRGDGPVRGGSDSWDGGRSTDAPARPARFRRAGRRRPLTRNHREDARLHEVASGALEGALRAREWDQAAPSNPQAASRVSETKAASTKSRSVCRPVDKSSPNRSRIHRLSRNAGSFRRPIVAA